MSASTIQISDRPVGALRESLLAARQDLHEQAARAGAVADEAASAARERLDELDSLLTQLDAAVGAGELRGSRTTLWSIVYDATCRLAERVADDCNDYWRGETEIGQLRSGLADLSACVDLLEALGPPPGAEVGA